MTQPDGDPPREDSEQAAQPADAEAPSEATGPGEDAGSPEADAASETGSSASAEGAAPRPEPPGDEEKRSTETVLIEAAAASFLETLKLGLEIVPHPTQGMVKYARSRPRSSSLVIIGIATLLFPLANWLSQNFAKVSLFLTGFVAILLANVVFGAVLVAGLAIHFRRSIDRRELLAVYAGSLIPFIPAVLVGWLLNFVKPGGNLFFACVAIGVALAALYLQTALRELYKLTADQAIYFSALCYGAWLLVWTAGTVSAAAV